MNNLIIHTEALWMIFNNLCKSNIDKWYKMLSHVLIYISYNEFIHKRLWQKLTLIGNLRSRCLVCAEDIIKFTFKALGGGYKANILRSVIFRTFQYYHNTR